ncbi:MAG: CDP-alcohol phosphatidyltransferase family protein [Solirubrobacterales bacterium]
MGRSRQQSFRIGRPGKGFRRLFGLDRSGPPPRQTRPGQPLRPWTIPNLVGYLRLAALPVFLAIAFSSGDGRDATAAGIYLAISLGDYLDGFLARATGQYSRMGALLDPVVDRLTILAGAVVCWNFELLPRWALAILAAREVITLVLAQLSLRRGQALEINWFGRLAVFPIMGAIFWAMVVESVAWELMLIAGVALAVLSTVTYVRTGLRGLAAA